MELLYSLLTKFIIYSIFILSLNNFIIGKTGYWAIGHLGLFAAGALITGIMTIVWKLSGYFIYTTFVFSIFGALILSLIPAIGLIRLRGDFFIFISLAFVETIRVIIEIIAGPSGFSDIPRPPGLTTDLSFMLFCLSIFIIAVLYVLSLQTHPLHNISVLVRLSEPSAQSFGINTYKIRVGFFTIGGILASLSGCLFAFYSNGTDPQRLNLNEAVTLFALTILGGIDSVRGSVLAAAFYVLIIFFLESFLRGPLGVYAPKITSLIFGLILIFAINFLPKGIMGNRSL